MPRTTRSFSRAGYKIADQLQYMIAMVNTYLLNFLYSDDETRTNDTFIEC